MSAITCVFSDSENPMSRVVKHAVSVTTLLAAAMLTMAMTDGSMTTTAAHLGAHVVEPTLMQRGASPNGRCVWCENECVDPWWLCAVDAPRNMTGCDDRAPCMWNTRLSLCTVNCLLVKSSHPSDRAEEWNANSQRSLHVGTRPLGGYPPSRGIFHSWGRLPNRAG